LLLTLDFTLMHLVFPELSFCFLLFALYNLLQLNELDNRVKLYYKLTPILFAEISLILKNNNKSARIC
jgi:hypothetical protein